MKLLNKSGSFILLLFLLLNPIAPVFAADTGVSRNFNAIASGLSQLSRSQLTGIRADQSTGAFTYNYPITVPPGRNGLAPTLNLVYSSQNKDNASYVGYGWSLDIPHIQRQNKHGSDQLYNYTDFVSSVGGELVKVSTTTYYAEVETGDYMSYTFDNNYWTVYDQNGTRYLYGATTTARQFSTTTTSNIYKWMLEEVRDTNDNYISYEYYKEDGQVYPSKITYTGHGSIDGIFEISFTRETADISDKMYDTGFPVETDYRIKEITVKENSSWVRQYVLAYTAGHNGTRQLLSSVTESGRNPDTGSTVTLPAETFTYKAGSIGWEQTSGGDWELPQTLYDNDSQDSRFLRIGDINGDAYPDIVYSAEGDGPTGCSNNERTIWINDTQGGWDKYDCTGPEWYPSLFLKRDNHAFKDGGTRMFDYNGDFLNDMVFSFVSTGTSSVSSYDVRRNTGNKTNTWATTSVATPVGFVFGTNLYADNGTQIVDFNGDGLSDIVYGWLDDDGGGLLESAYVNNSAGWDEAASGSWELPWAIVDENVDGTEVFTFAQFLDLNGDGLLDYAFEHGDISIGEKIGINTGNNWNTDHDWYTHIPIATEGNDYLISNKSDNGVRTMDVNGDGITDWTYSAGGSKQINLGTIHTSSYEYTNASIPIDFASSNNESNPRVIITDINADGMVDFLVAHETGTTINKATYLATSSPFTDMLTNINTPEGASTTISYKMSTQYFNSSNNLLNPDLPIGVVTVESITTNDGLGNETVETYSYQDGSFYFADSFDRQFAGFGLVTKEDAVGNLTKTYFHQGNTSSTTIGEFEDHIDKAGKPYRIEQYDNSNNLYTKTINKWDRYDRGSSASFIKLAQSVEFTYDGDADHIEKAFSYTYNDSTGQTAGIVEYGEVSGSDNGTFSDTGTDDFTTTYTYATSTATSTPSYHKVSRETVTNYNSDKVREQKIYYDSLSFGNLDEGNPTKVEQWVSGSTYIDTERTYNSYGLVTQSKDPRDKAITYVYDTYNLYPATTTNALSQSTTNTYDYATGQVELTTDPNGNQFQTLYDPLGRVLEVLQTEISSSTEPVAFLEDTDSNYASNDSFIDKLGQFALSIVATPAYAQTTLEAELKGRSNAEKANLKAKEISKLNFNGRIHVGGLQLEIVSIEKIDKGVQVFVRAWKNGKQIGFGRDGSVDIERFRFFNPPVLVDDPQGGIVRSSVDAKTGEVRYRTLREDPREALLQSLSHVIGVKKQKFGPENIEKGKVGNTTDIFYPYSGDGQVVNDGSTSWSTIRDATSGTYLNYSATGMGAATGRYTGGKYRITRMFIPFDTSSLSGSDVIDSATLSLYAYQTQNIDNDGDDYITLVQGLQTSVSSLVNSDYANVGSIELSNQLDITSISTGAYSDLTLNSTGIAAINKGGDTKFAVREGHDIINSPIVASYYNYNEVAVYAVDQTGTTQDPKLVIEHHSSGVSSTPLVTKIKYTYYDNVFPRKIKAEKYLDDTTISETHTYFDGLNRKVEERIEMEDNGTFSVRDYYYNNRGLIANESLSWAVEGSAYTGTSTPAASTLMTYYNHDPLGRIKTVANTVGTTTTSYDDWVSTVTDPLSNSKEYTKDARGNLVEVVENNGASSYTTTYQYDGNNNLTKVTDAEGNVRNFTYDGLGRRLTAQDLHDSSDGTYGTWTYEYDNSGNLATTTDPKSQVVVHTYDDINRVLTENYTGESGTEITYSYDSCSGGIGQLCTASTTHSVTDYTYNALGLVKNETRTINGTDYETAYAYDRLGNTTGILYPDDSEVVYTYNTSGQLETIKQKESGGSFNYLISDFDYHPTGAVILKSFGNQATTTITYDEDELYRLRQIETESTTTQAFSGAFSRWVNWLPMVVYASTTESVDTDNLAVPKPLPPVIEEASQASTTEEVIIEPSTATSTEESTSTSTPSVDTTNTATSTPATASSTDPVATSTPQNASSSTPVTIEGSQGNASTTPPGEVFGAATSTEAGTSTVPVILPLSTTTPTFTPPALDLSTTTASTTPPLKLTSIIPVLEGKSARERATIKGSEIDRLVKKDIHVRKGGLKLEIVDSEIIDGGVQVFVRAWKNGKQIGFGPDGTVDIERFRFFNPPILVADDSGDIVQEWTDDNTEQTHRRTLREDPEEAILQVIEKNLGVMKNTHDDSAIVPGKRGNTTSTFFPAAGGSTPVDGYAAFSNGYNYTWGAMRNKGGNQANYTGSVAVFAGQRKYAAQTWQQITRSFFGFDTSLLGGGSISAATFSVKVSSVSSGFGAVAALDSKTPASTNEIIGSDYSINGWEGVKQSDNTYADTSLTAGDWMDFGLNSTGLSNINETGLSWFGGRLEADITNTLVEDFDAFSTKNIVVYAADQTGTSDDPKLVVEHYGTPASSISGNIQRLSYVYDSMGNITKIVDTSETQTSATTTYTYDNLYRLTSASTTDATSTPYSRTWGYSSIGNIASSSHLGTYTYNDDGHNNPHAADTIDGVDLTYDNNGNLTSYASSTYAWDYKNRLASSSDSVTDTSYGYDHNDQRVIKTVDSVSTIYPNQYYSVEGATSTKYIYAGDELVAYVEADGVATTTHYVHPNHLGSTQVVTDESGAVELTKDYYPFGSSRVGSGDASLSRGYIGQFEDGDDMSYLNARYYKSDRGQFMSQDPVFLAVGNGTEIKARTGFDMLTVLSDPQQLNSYAYARNNPIRYKDPTGNLSWEALLSNPVGSLQHVAGWGFASLGVNAINRPFTATLLRHSASLEPGSININTGNQKQYGNVINQIRGTDQYQSFVNQAIENAKNGNGITSGSLQFDKGDLYTSLHRANIQVNVEQTKDGWSANTTISDTYDFNPTNPQTYKGTVTRIPATQAYKDQQNGVLSNYDVKIKFNDKIKDK